MIPEFFQTQWWHRSRFGIDIDWTGLVWEENRIYEDYRIHAITIRIVQPVEREVEVIPPELIDHAFSMPGVYVN